jgi:hypothetical protein
MGLLVAGVWGEDCDAAPLEGAEVPRQVLLRRQRLLGATRQGRCDGNDKVT